ncbi:MAG: iron-sulfur protein [Clostridia bacterium]
MNILVLNGSPKGKSSITVQTPLYLSKRYPKHDWSVLHVGQKIKYYEKNFTEVKQGLEKADLIIFTYPVYTFLAPYQVHKFVELMKENNVDLKGKFASQISTSKHFFDITAHKWIEENVYDFGMKFIAGLSADMEDLLTEKGQKQAEVYFEKMIFDIENNIYHSKEISTYTKKSDYTSCISSTEKTGDKDVVIVTNCHEDDNNLKAMMNDFINLSSHNIRVINMRDFKFSGGCLGCLSCTTTQKCIYRDGFDDYLRNEIQNADAIVYAFTIENHYTHSSLKCYDDRQFCNGHRTVTVGMPVGYIISGDYSHEENLKTLVEARSDVGGVYLCGVATDEKDTSLALTNLNKSLEYALTHVMDKPATFYGVGGTKIFRDLVYLMQGMMVADHKFYKANGIYDFPHNKKGKMLQMKIIGGVMNIPSVQKKMKGKMNTFILQPYEKLMEKTAEKEV